MMRLLAGRLHHFKSTVGPAVGCSSAHTNRLSRSQATRQPGTVTPDTDISTAVAVAVEAAGLQSCHAEQLCGHLRDNWYATAGDVAAMSKEEVQRMRIPVKLWVSIKAMVADSRPAPGNQTTSTANMEARAYNALDASTAAISAEAEQQTQQTQQAQQQQAARVLPTVSLASSFLDPLPDDIMQRRMPSRGAVQNPRVLVRQPALQKTYAIKDTEMSAGLQHEFSKLQQFSCGVFYGQRVEPLRPVSYRAYQYELRLLLGYAHRVKGVPLDQLSLRSLLPSPGREGVSLLMEYQHWRQAERGVGARTLIMPIKASIALARYLYHEQSQPDAKPPYRDLEVVQELASMLRAAQRAGNAAPLVADESKKWLQWDEFLGMVRALQAECAGLTPSGQPRVRSEVAASLQRYLIVAILSVVPDRQRTLRELELGRTLLQRDDGSWIIKHGSADYKTGKKYGDRPPLVIAPFIYPELEAFIHTWRQELAPKTNKLFCRARTGQEMDGKALYAVFKKVAVRLTGKATHPHLVRGMIVTHLRDRGTSEAEMESLAMLMGHSLKEQRGTYDRRTKAQRVTPAVDLFLQLSKDL